MRKFDYSDELADIVQQVLDGNRHYTFDEECGVFEFPIKSEGKIQNIKGCIEVYEDFLVVRGKCPIQADCENPEMMAQIAEYICRVNCTLTRGHFDLNFSNGDVLFTSSIDCCSTLPSSEVINSSIETISDTFHGYGRGLMDVLFSRSSAEKAYKECINPVGVALSTLYNEIFGTQVAAEDLDTLFSDFAFLSGIADGICDRFGDMLPPRDEV